MDTTPLPIAKPQPRGLHNRKCQENAWDRWLRTGQEIVAVCSVDKKRGRKVAHIVNLNDKGEVIDDTWGSLTAGYDHFPLDLPKVPEVTPYTLLDMAKAKIASTLPWWRRVKHWLGWPQC
jgi:hypothetical protein